MASRSVLPQSGSSQSGSSQSGPSQSGSSRPGLPRIVAAVAAFVTTVGLAVAAVPTPAAATNTAQQLAAAKAALDRLDAQAEHAAERYNKARLDLASAQRTAVSAQARLARADAELAGLRTQVSNFAAAAYRGQDLSSFFVIANSDPGELLDRVSTLQAVSRSQQDTLAELARARHAQVQAQADASAALAAAQDTTRELKVQKAAVQRAAQQQMRIVTALRSKQAAELQARARAAAAAAASLAVAPAAPPVVRGSGGAAVAVQWAYKELGKPYVYGAAGPDAFDCSGLTQYVWAKAGVYLSHYTGAQWNEGQHVSRDQLQPGDLVFFGSDLHHMGLYIGNGQMIEAPHTGAYVRIASYDRPDYAGAVRPGT
jgi:cell wall-associated NlpC family hydrolase